MGNEKDIIKDFREVEKHRLVYFIADEAERKYREFKKAEKDTSTFLYIGDFRPLSNKGSNSSNSLELILPSEIFTTVDYSSVLLSLLRVFDLDRSSPDFESGSGKAFADEKTQNLNRFKQEYPDSKLHIEYMSFGLIAPEDEERRIVRSRFFDPVTKEPLTEVWEAVKFKTS